MSTERVDAELAAENPPIEQLRSIDPGASAEIVNPNGWGYSTNIGVLAQRAVAQWERERAEAAVAAKNAAYREGLFLEQLVEKDERIGLLEQGLADIYRMAYIKGVLGCDDVGLPIQRILGEDFNAVLARTAKPPEGAPGAA